MTYRTPTAPRLPSRIRFLLPAALCLLAADSSHATNGMNLEAYGAKAGGMGGAAFAYDSGNSGVMNNPATLALRPDKQNDFGLGLTLLAPNVSASHPAAGSVDSNGTAYWMPTIGYIRNQGDFAYGVAMMAQGGMGTEYGAGSSLFAGGMSALGNPVALSGQEIRSEVGFGRLMFPLAWKANERLNLAGQIDLVWAGMDLQMDMDGNTLAGMMGSGLATGGITGALAGLGDLHYARFDFSDNNDMTGKAKSYGWGYKLGAVFKATDRLNLGLTYHAKTRMGDMKTDDAHLSAVGSGGSQAMTGELKVLNFQWPETYGIGLAWTPNEKWMWAADIKHIGWSDAMKDFRMQFVAGPGMDLDVTMPQNWRDQTVVAVGVQYKPTSDLALRFGANQSSNPVPNDTLNPLFPAIVERHYTAGVGYRLDPANSLAGAVTYAPEVSATSSVTGITSYHSQMSLRVNYNHTF
ncbi:MAG: outer membrane protein transport protein [Pseudomonadota bacterium]|nr:outer membrane protein transport protein [Pseudomonadota bacterium]